MTIIPSEKGISNSVHSEKWLTEEGARKSAQSVKWEFQKALTNWTDFQILTSNSSLLKESPLERAACQGLQNLIGSGFWMRRNESEIYFRYLVSYNHVPEVVAAALVFLNESISLMYVLENAKQEKKFKINHPEFPLGVTSPEQRIKQAIDPLRELIRLEKVDLLKEVIEALEKNSLTKERKAVAQGLRSLLEI